MKRSTQIFSALLNETQNPNFVHLNGKCFAEYNFIYHINDGYSIDQLSKFKEKDQLLFQKISSKILQMNLMIIDSIFPLILADVALDTFLYSISSFQEYSFSRNRLIINNTEFDREYLNYKLKYFIQHLLFSNISSEDVWYGNLDNYKVYYMKKVNGELLYYSIFEQKELQELLFKNLKLEINFEKSFIKNGKANICLTILF